MNRAKDWGLLLTCNFIWSAYFVLVKLVQRQVGPFFTTLFPIMLATLFLFPIVRWQRRRDGSLAKKSRMARSDIVDFLCIGILGQVCTQLFGAWGTKLSLATNGAVLFLILPICTAIMAYIFLGERMSMVRWISFALALAGVLVCSGITSKGLDFSSSKYFIGNIMLAVSVFGSAFYNVYSKKVLRRYSPLEVLFYSYMVLDIFMFPFTEYLEPSGFRNLGHYSLVVWSGLILLAVFQYFLAMIIFLHVLARIDATQAALSNYLIPVFGVVLAALILHERLTSSMIIGGALVLGSTLLITLYEELLPRQKAIS